MFLFEGRSFFEKVGKFLDLSVTFDACWTKHDIPLLTQCSASVGSKGYLLQSRTGEHVNGPLQSSQCSHLIVGHCPLALAVQRCQKPFAGSLGKLLELSSQVGWGDDLDHLLRRLICQSRFEFPDQLQLWPGSSESADQFPCCEGAVFWKAISENAGWIQLLGKGVYTVNNYRRYNTVLGK